MTIGDTEKIGLARHPLSLQWGEGTIVHFMAASPGQGEWSLPEGISLADAASMDCAASGFH